MLVKLAVLAAVGSAVAAAPAQGQDGGAPAFDWDMPARMGEDRDGDGFLDYASSAEAVGGGPYEVRFRVRRDLCRPGTVYGWRVGGEEVESDPGDCSLEWAFEEEGTPEVELDVEGDGEEPFRREVVVQDWLVVSIGDSVASGEGNPDRPRAVGRAGWHGPRCHRSMAAAPVKAALALERADPRTSVTFVHLACSGAELREGLIDGYRGIEVPRGARPELLPPQLDELARIAAGREVDAVLVSAGANDLHFGPAVVFCLRFTRCMDQRFDPRTPRRRGSEPLPDVIAGRLERLRRDYVTLGERLRAAPPGGAPIEPGRVVLTGYFDPTRDRRGRFCTRIGVPGFRIDSREAEWAYRNILRPLNVEIELAARREGWTAVSGVSDAFRTHGYCAGRRLRWIRTIPRSLVTQAGGRTAGALHPNEDGHRETAVLLSGALQRGLYDDDGPRPPVESGSAAGGGALPFAGGGEGERSAPAAEDGEDREAGSQLEDDAALALLGLLALALIGLAARWLWRRRRGRARAPELAPAPLPISATPGGRTPPGADPMEIGRLLLRRAEWVHRRVETIEFVDEMTIRRRVSVDFTLPPPRDGGEPPVRYVPLALLSKKTLTNFDLRSEDGAALPLLTAAQNASLAREFLIALAEQANDGEPLPHDLIDLLDAVATSAPLEARRAVDVIRTSLEPADLRERLRMHDVFREAVETFAGNFPVMVEIEHDGRRRVIKFAYDEAFRGPGSLLTRLGLTPFRVRFRLPELGDASSRHLEFRRAPGLEMVGASLVAFDPDGTPRVKRQAGLTPEAHLNVTGAPRGTRAIAEVGLRVRRQGILVGGPLFGGVTAAVLVGAWFALPGISEEAGGVGALLLAVPATLGAYLGARSPHALASAMLLGARALVFLCGLLAFVTAAALALDPPVSDLRLILGATAAASIVTFLGLLAIFLRPRAEPALEPPMRA